MTEQQAPVEFEPAPVIPTVAPKKRNPLDTVLVVAAAIALAGVAFATGRLTAPVSITTAAAQGATGGTTVSGQAGTGQAGTGQNSTGQNGGGRTRGSFDPNASFAPGQGGQGGQGGLGGGAAGVTLTGTVTAISSTSITLKLQNGTEVTIPIETTTTYHQSTTSSATSVTSGATVEVRVTGGAGGGQRQQPGASPAPGATGGTVQFGNAVDITVVK